MTPVYTETFFLSAGETNAEQEMSLPLLVSKLIDIATAHANNLGIGNPAMEDIDAGWVLSRLTVEMESYPKVNETYCISTWVEDFNRHFSVRSFSISSPDGKIYGYSRSIWMVMHKTNHTNVGLSHLALPEGVITGKLAPIGRQARHFPIIDTTTSNEPLPSGALPANREAYDYSFQYCDLDSYRHVNTVRYVNLLLNRYTLAEHDASFVKRLELSFLHEARYGEPTRLLRHDSQDTPGLSAFLLTDRSDAAPLMFARLLMSHR